MNPHLDKKHQTVTKRAGEQRKENEHHDLRRKIQEQIKELTFDGVHFVHSEGIIELHLAQLSANSNLV